MIAHGVRNVWLGGESLRNRQRVPLAHGRGALIALIAVNNDQNLVRADGRIAAQGAIGDHKTKHAVANSAPQDIRHVHGPSLYAVISTDDFEAIPLIAVAVARAAVIPTAVAVVRGAVVPIIAGNIEHTDFNEATLVVIEFALLIPAIFGEDAQRLVFPDGRIPAHGLVVHRDSAIHAAASDEVFENIADISALIPEAVISAQDLPAFFLGAHSSAEDGGANSEDDHTNDAHRMSI